jgi:hypothetical protein
MLLHDIVRINHESFLNSLKQCKFFLMKMSEEVMIQDHKFGLNTGEYNSTKILLSESS